MNLEKLLKLVNPTDVANLTSQLVRIPSHKGIAGRETEVVLYIDEWLSNNKIESEIHYVEGRPFLIATISGQGGNNAVVFNGHADTVNVDFMENPFSGEIDTTYVHGRGACDMKGALSSMMIAFKIINENYSPFSDVHFYVSLGEEDGTCPSSHIITEFISPKHAIVGEPTKLELHTANKGLYFIKLISKGKSAHLSVPEKGINAIENLVRLYNLMEQTYIDQVSRDYDGKSLFVPCNISGGSEGIPDYAELLINRRTMPGESFENDKREIEALIYGLRSSVPDLDIEVRQLQGYENLDLSPMSPPEDVNFVNLVHTYLEVSLARKIPVSMTPGWTEGSILRSKGIDTMIFGPGSLEYAHTPIERVPINDLYDAARGYISIVLALNKR